METKVTIQLKGYDNNGKLRFTKQIYLLRGVNENWKRRGVAILVDEMHDWNKKGRKQVTSGVGKTQNLIQQWTQIFWVETEPATAQDEPDSKGAEND